MDEFWRYLLLCLAAFLAGVMNSIAGGGTLLTFPALMSVISPVLANCTSTVALLPGSVAGAWGYRSELSSVWRKAKQLLVISLFGGILGALLVTRRAPDEFERLVPFLILLASFLFLIQPVVSKWIKQKGSLDPSHEQSPTTGISFMVAVFQFFIAVYGGYFGAGIGILMLTALAFMHIGDIHQMNAVKTFLACGINGIAVVVFIWDDKVVWHFAIIMAVAAILGGYFGARFARRLPAVHVRVAVILIGFGMSGFILVQDYLLK